MKERYIIQIQVTSINRNGEELATEQRFATNIATDNILTADLLALDLFTQAYDRLQQTPHTVRFPGDSDDE